jgi:hypothetical protein
MKSPLMIGLLLTAAMGVSAYNLEFFKNYSKEEIETANLQPSWETLEPLILEPTEEAEPSGGLRPAISLEELQIQSRQAYMPENFPSTGDSYMWPNRDPFRDTEGKSNSTPVTPRVPSSGSAKNAPRSVSIAEPELEFSGTFIQNNRKLALIDGVPQPVGALLGNWRLSAIGSDYIILEGGGKTRRVELNNESPDTFQLKSDS